MKDGWKFVIDYHGGRTNAWADGLRIAKNGDIRLLRQKKVVGVIRDGYWTRIYIDAEQPEGE